MSGTVLVAAGLGLLATMRADTPYWHLAIFMSLIGVGVGMTRQNLVLAAQNEAAPQDLGPASSLVSFTRSLGGAIGVSALGALLGHRITHNVTAAPIALLAVLIVLFIKEVPLGTASAHDQLSGSATRDAVQHPVDEAALEEEVEHDDR